MPDHQQFNVNMPLCFIFSEFEHVKYNVPNAIKSCTEVLACIPTHYILWTGQKGSKSFGCWSWKKDTSQNETTLSTEEIRSVVLFAAKLHVQRVTVLGPMKALAQRKLLTVLSE